MLSVLFGSIYGLLSLGLALLWRILGIINFSHGIVILLGGYLSYSLIIAGLHPILAFCIPALILAIIGAVFQRFMVNRVVDSILAALIVTIGFAYAIEGTMTLVWGPSNFGITSSILPTLMPEITLPWFSVRPELLEVFIFSTTIVALLHFFLLDRQHSAKLYFPF